MAHGPVVHKNFSRMKTILAAYLMLCIKVFLFLLGLSVGESLHL